jgi:hypothetical protein
MIGIGANQRRLDRIDGTPSMVSLSPRQDLREVIVGEAFVLKEGKCRSL